MKGNHWFFFCNCRNYIYYSINVMLWPWLFFLC